MIDIKLTTAKANFFDRPGVQKRVDAIAKRALSRFGAFVRRRAQTSIRKRKKSSPPGSPPSSHEGSLRKNIFFVYDADAKSVVIGPILLNKGTGAPRMLEFGGSVEHDKKTRRYKGNPFMKPAFDAEVPNAAKLFKGFTSA